MRDLHPDAPPVGWRVQFLINGDPNLPVPADVIERGDGGAVKLNVCYPGWIVPTRRFIRHVDDPFHDEHRRLLLEPEGGAWDWVPGLVYQPAVQKPAENRALSKIRELAEAGRSPEDIGRAVRGYGLRQDDVNRILEELAVPV